jgi:hypothetical protein
LLWSGERPYICNFCGRGFCESGNLKKHLRVHGKEIPAVVKQNNRGGDIQLPEQEEEEEQPGHIYAEEEVRPFLLYVLQGRVSPKTF